MQLYGLGWAAAFLRYVDRTLLDKIRDVKRNKQEILEESHFTINSLTMSFENCLLDDRNRALFNEFNFRVVEQWYVDLKAFFPSLDYVSSNETEKIANKMLSDVYYSVQSVDDFVSNLKMLKKSQSNRNTEVLCCIIFNVLQEYIHFPNYPEKQLLITAEFLGKFVLNSIVDGKTQVVILKGIADALKQDNSMFKFGLKALEQFVFQPKIKLDS